MTHFSANNFINDNRINQYLQKWLLPRSTCLYTIKANSNMQMMFLECLNRINIALLYCSYNERFFPFKIASLIHDKSNLMASQCRLSNVVVIAHKTGHLLSLSRCNICCNLCCEKKCCKLHDEF